MKEIIRVYAAILSNKINLQSLAQAFNIDDYEKWKGYLCLDSLAVGKLLKYHKENTKIYVYQFGCVALVGLDENEERNLLKNLAMFLLEKDHIENDFYSMHSECSLEDVHIQAEAMVRSIRLRWIETRIEELDQEAEDILEKIKKGIAIRRFSKLYSFIAKLQRFEIECAGVLAILGKAYKGEEREKYYQLINEYELHERLAVLTEKIKILRQISDTHDLFGRFIGWQRLLFIEAILLFIFPILGMLD